MLNRLIFFVLCYKRGWEKSIIVTTVIMLICILMDIKKIHYAWKESWNWRKVRWRGWRSKRPEICSPANFAAQTVAKQLIVHLPPSSASSCFGGCLWKRRSCFGSDERGRAELEPVRRVFAKCLIKTFVASCGEGVPKLNATSWLPIFEMRDALVRLCWLKSRRKSSCTSATRSRQSLDATVNNRDRN